MRYIITGGERRFIGGELDATDEVRDLLLDKKGVA